MELSLVEFVLMVLWAAFGLVVLCTMVSRALHARAESRSLKRLVICRLCLHAFDVQGRVKIVCCPRCGAANEKGRNRRLG